MDNKIIILPEELVDKIAAGEVVERPASVVKELVENSVDAGAKNVDVEIKKGGIKFIRVTDDGTGMDEKNATLAFQRHATSKIKDSDDLFQIATLGFRGEALPSIAAVCFLDMLTRTAESLSGTRLKSEGGVIKETKQMGSPVGTSVIVRELFYNVPARRKFLKTVLTETRHIIDLLTRFAIAYPEISFKLKSDERELFSFGRAADLKERVTDIFGQSQIEKMLEIRAGKDKPAVAGFLGKPEIARSNRAELYLFVNRRPIVSRSLYHAVQSGYGQLLPKGKFPFAVVMIQIDPKLVDVNVHPAKSEIRFADERGMHDLVHTTIKECLTSSRVISEFRAEKEQLAAPRPEATEEVSHRGQRTDFAAEAPHQVQQPPLGARPEEEQESTQRTFLSDTPDKVIQPSSEKPPKVEEGKEARPERKVQAEITNLWQLADTYILSQVKGNLMVLDQHAAHERILYEEALRNLTKSAASSQQVLFPTVLELAPKEFQILEEHKDLICRLGFDIKHFGGRSILVTAVPSIIRSKSGEVFLREILAQVEEEGRQEKDRVRVVAKSFACHGSVKAGERLSQEEMQHLVKQLFTTEEPYSCPHGRPTVIKLSLEELNKKFGRN